MKYLRKIHDRRAPPGLERKILRMLPRVLLGGTMVPLLMSLGARLFPPQGTAAEIAKQTMTLDIFSFALGVTIWSAVITVTFGCIVVAVMKGPAYVADAYPVSHADRPREEQQDD